MKERPILFSGPMVTAILDGRKTQTRRVIKGAEFDVVEWANGYWQGVVNGDGACQCSEIECPYGVEGDRLYVRETWAVSCAYDYLPPKKISAVCCPVHYFAGGEGSFDFENGECGKKRVSIHMPRWASRITLEVKGVRVERLCDISEKDAEREGVAVNHYYCEEPYFDDHGEWHDGVHRCDPVSEFALLWESINGEGSWDANPWVWVVEFERIKR